MVDDRSDHELRRRARRARSHELVDRAADTIPSSAARGEQLKQDLLDAARAAGVGRRRCGPTLKAGLRTQADDPDSRAAATAGRRRRRQPASGSRDDPVLQARGRDGCRVRRRGYVVEHFQRRDRVARQRHDRPLGRRGDLRRLELLLGPDLQFIRINGTVVGALAGLVIHAIAQVL